MFLVKCTVVPPHHYFYDELVGFYFYTLSFHLFGSFLTYLVTCLLGHLSLFPQGSKRSVNITHHFKLCIQGLFSLMS